MHGSVCKKPHAGGLLCHHAEEVQVPQVRGAEVRRRQDGAVRRIPASRIEVPI